MPAYIRHICARLPEHIETNDDLEREHPEWNMKRLASKTGIRQRHIAGEYETASDLAFAAAEQLLEQMPLRREDVDILIFCTQTPDYLLPTTACILQQRLRLGLNCGAFDINLGCSGYVYGLGIGKAMVESGQARNVLLLTGDTYSKLCRRDDRSVRPLFGDAGSCTWISQVPDTARTFRIGRVLYGTDGGGAEHLIVRGGASKEPQSEKVLFMNGAEVFNFTLQVVPSCVHALLQAEGLTIANITQFVFHQANEHMLKHLRDRIGIPPERFLIDVATTGNTVSSSIPLALARNPLPQASDQPVVLCGFGVGSSWASCLLC
jgi:3-oxoacyl-[acyl-carrier-protein] synthase-3